MKKKKEWDYGSTTFYFSIDFNVLVAMVPIVKGHSFKQVVS